MTPIDILHMVADGRRPVPGRHVIVSAHPDDETISFGGALCLLDDAVIVQVTTGVHAGKQSANQSADRLQERQAALQAGGWDVPVIDAGVCGREAHRHLVRLLALLETALEGADVVWTHPYEGGHLDHDSAAWLVQTACQRLPLAPARLEFASYHSRGERRDVFGAFWSDPRSVALTRTLVGEHKARKRAAIAAYTSQASILRKFPMFTEEPYRVAPVYDFAQPPPPVGCRWDLKGYTPSTAEWRQHVARAEQQLEQEAA